MKVDGGCYCGRITFEAEVDPAKVMLCHCTDCQALTGSAFRALVHAPRETFVLRGEPKVYLKTAESGTQRAHAFCPDCGSPVYSAAPVDPPMYSLRIGTLRQAASLQPSRQIWCQSALPWAMDLRVVARRERQ